MKILSDALTGLWGNLRRMTVAFAPPNPNELVNAYSTLAADGLRTMENLQSGSGDSSVEVGGSHCSRSVIRQITTSAAPAAPSKWPMLDLVELTAIAAACLPAQRLMAAASALSFSGVPVP